MRLIKVALAPLPIYRTWTKKSRDKTMRLEKEIIMLRQLLDNAIPEDANNYLTIVSEGLREIEEVITIDRRCSLIIVKHKKYFNTSFANFSFIVVILKFYRR
jgi:hypothetical protein